MPSNDYTDERKAMLVKTARLKALRLAKETEELQSAEPAPAKKPTKAKATKVKRPHAALR